MRALVLLIALTTMPATVASQGMELTSSDRLAMLYSPQLQFSVDGDPLIKIGIIEGQSEISFTPSDDIHVFPLGEGGPSIGLPAGVRYTVRLANGQPGSYRYWAVVGRLLPSEREQVVELRNRWTNWGFSPSTFHLGSVFAVRGTQFDNRETIIAVGGFDDRDRALGMAEELEMRLGVPVDLHTELVDFPSGELQLVGNDLSVDITHRDLLWITTGSDGTFEVTGDSFSTNPEPGDGSPRRYVGALIFTLDKSGALALVNELPAERLLNGILPAEIYASAPAEALRAQAVAARGELLADLGVRYLAEPYTTCGDQRCQVYRGIDLEDERTSDAVRQTRGVVLLHDGHIARAVYSASCGGSLGDHASTWGGEPVGYLTAHFDAYHPPQGFEGGLNESNVAAFLAARPDTFENIDRYNGQRLFRWNVERSAAELSESLADYGVGRVTALEVLERDVSGRVFRLQVTGTQGEVVIERELPIRRALGGLRSALFVMDVHNASDGSLSRVSFSGAGYGHGVGLCQIGAIGAAERGLDYTEILSHYYSGTRVQQVW